MPLEPSACRPEEIERKSFEIIERELGDRVPEGENAAVVKRVIHATADFDFADSLYFFPGSVQVGVRTLRRGARIICDTEMVLSGINKDALGRLGCTAHCFMSDPEVAREAGERGVTRASVGMERAVKLGDKPLVFAIGNAPTALIRLYELCREGRVYPHLVIGVPVGFVNVVEAKELFVDKNLPVILSRGRKGGSAVAAAICNALLYEAGGRG